VRVAVANLKGGCGKTLTSVFLANALAGRGRTLLVDADPQGSALSWASAAEEEGELPYRAIGLPTKDVHKKLMGLADDYAHVVIDTPPVETAITRAALMAADTALIVVPPTKIDLDRVMATLELVAEVEPLNDLSYRVLLTRVRRITREGQDTREAMGQMGLSVLDTEIPQLSRYSDAFGEAVTDVGDYERAAAELLGEEE
jgi:chromosome partitioning protein